MRLDASCPRVADRQPVGSSQRGLGTAAHRTARMLGKTLRVVCSASRARCQREGAADRAGAGEGYGAGAEGGDEGAAAGPTGSMIVPFGPWTVITTRSSSRIDLCWLRTSSQQQYTSTAKQIAAGIFALTPPSLPGIVGQAILPAAAFQAARARGHAHRAIRWSARKSRRCDASYSRQSAKTRGLTKLSQGAHLRWEKQCVARRRADSSVCPRGFRPVRGSSPFPL
jgi:hypothetical protein